MLHFEGYDAGFHEPCRKALNARRQLAKGWLKKRRGGKTIDDTYTVRRAAGGEFVLVGIQEAKQYREAEEL